MRVSLLGNGQAQSCKALVRDCKGACRVHGASIMAPMMIALIFLEWMPPQYQQLLPVMVQQGIWRFTNMWGCVEDYVARNLHLMW